MAPGHPDACVEEDRAGHGRFHHALSSATISALNGVAYAYARLFREDVSGLAGRRRPAAGTTISTGWHDPGTNGKASTASSAPDEMLDHGRREGVFLHSFFDAPTLRCRCDRPERRYRSVHRQFMPHGARSRPGWSCKNHFGSRHRGRPAIVAERGELTIPILPLGARRARPGQLMAEMMREVPEDVTEFRVPGAAHRSPRRIRRYSATVDRVFRASPFPSTLTALLARYSIGAWHDPPCRTIESELFRGMQMGRATLLALRPQR